MVRVVMPYHLKTLTGLQTEVQLEVPPDCSLGGLLNALENRFPVLRGTLRDNTTGTRRPFIRFFACKEDLSHQPMDLPLPKEVQEGREPLLMVGAMAGG